MGPQTGLHRRGNPMAFPFRGVDFLELDSLLTEQERMVRDTARGYAQDKLFPRVLLDYREERFDRAVFSEMGALGLLGSTIDGYGCPGVNYVCYGLIAREIERVDSSYRSALSVQSSLVMWPIYAYGTEEQRQKYLPKLATGELVGAIAMTEPGTGSDLQGVKTSAKRDGNGYVVNGAKTFITNGGTANLIIVVCKTDPAAGAKGTSLVVVRLNCPPEVSMITVGR